MQADSVYREDAVTGCFPKEQLLCGQTQMGGPGGGVQEEVVTAA